MFFLSFRARMGNMHGWGGPLPSTWYKMQLALQHKILTSMRNFGMSPVLPGFAGHVPKGLTRIYPKANVSKLGDWGNFNATYCCTYLLDPSDPLFKVSVSYACYFEQDYYGFILNISFSSENWWSIYQSSNV